MAFYLAYLWQTKSIIMKKLLVAFTLIMAAFVFKAEAQVRVNVGVNIGDQPDWGPPGYDYVDYYYFPDMDIYYNVPQRNYVYFDNGRWAFSASLPSRYRGYDMYHSYKVVINEPRPYLRNDYYRSRYYSYRGRRDQEIRRDHHDNGNHNGWYKNGKYDRYENGNRGGRHGRGRGRD
jgi:hypothetical protein